MSNTISIHFKCQGQMYSLMLKTPVGEISLSMVEARIYKKLALDENKVKLRLSYIPLLIGFEEQWIIYDDEDMSVFLTSIDKENRRCILYVEVKTNSELLEEASRVEKINDDEIASNALTLYVANDPEKQQHEVKEGDDDDDDKSHEECVDRRAELFEFPYVVESSQFILAWEDGLGVKVHQEFPNKKALQEFVDRAAFENSFGYAIKWSDKTIYVVRYSQERCKWGLRGARVPETYIFSIRTYTKMHTCSQASQSSSNSKRKCNPRLAACLLHDDYPGVMKTTSPKVIMERVQNVFGVKISYSTALRGKYLAASDLRGSREESFKMLYCYLYMLEEVNPNTITSVKLDEMGKFKYLFIALGASIEGFEVMRKVIIVDATFIKNGYGGVLVFASAQDPNRHIYPIAFGVLDGENIASWTWFFEMLKAVVPDSSEVVFMSDRNASLINAINYMFPQAHHGYCVWHLSQNVKGHATNVNRDIVAWRFMECSRLYTVAEFNSSYALFKTHYPSAAKYVEKITVKEKWARCFFPGDIYNIDTSNCVEYLNSVFEDARKYSLIPMLDTIVKVFSKWFNEHRKETVSGSIDNKLMSLLENYFHDLWPFAEKLHVTELNYFEMEYDVTGSNEKSYLVNLVSKSCSCMMFDIEKYPCLHGLAAFIEYKRDTSGRVIQLELPNLCSKYYWTEMWAMAYHKTIYLVSNRSEWNIPDDIAKMQIIPPEIIKKKGRKKVKRFPSAGERRRRTQNKRRPRQRLQWLLFGNRSSV